ncbi:DUF4129 domain-containing protein [Nonomuraea soli]|uniref:Protein-glutamine gamma-glutamyltransferase-like C-terminal domain-containing protein n=1 Tax=Nonomuraea soli TaxID=1032476 RepID=A0A7W0CRL4_9ACTN|nr:DUF4129 domain-containing protein [Nonomuraea soli]MBA2895967.1 hypothetical protein [Nonomuraea soli]
MRWWPVGLALGALLIVGLASMTISGIHGEFDSGVGDFSALGPPAPAKKPGGGDGDHYVFRDNSFNTDLWFSLFGWLLVALPGVTIIVIIYEVIKYLLSRRRPYQPSAHRGPAVEEEELHPELVRAAVRAGLQELDAGDDPRKAVIACWLRLEHEAAEAGAPRLVGDTPEELVARLLADHDEDALRRLMGAYHLARYAPHEVSEELRSAARRALQQLHASRNLVETSHE